jgi:hypothetical protein
MAMGNLRIKVLIGVAAAIGVFLLVTSGPSDEANAVVAPRIARAQPVSDEQQLLGHPAGRNVSSTRETFSVGTVSELLHRMNNRVAARGDSKALFHKLSWYVPPPPPPPPPAPVYTPPPPPTAPALPFGVMGSYSRPGDPTVYFLTRNDRVFDVRVGDTIDSTYKVDGEANGQLLLTYMPLKIQQSLTLGAAQ